MKNKEEIIRRAEIVLCVSDRCSLERYSKEHSFKERCEQRIVIADWLEANGLYEYMENTDKLLFKKKVGSIFCKNIFIENKFQHEALEPLLWSLGLIPRMTSYSQYALDDVHVMMCVNVPNTVDEMMKKTVLKSEEDIEFRRKIAMLWHWRAIEGKNQIFKHEPIKDILLQIFGDEYKKAINYIMKNQTSRIFVFMINLFMSLMIFLFGIYINGHCGAIMHFNGFFRVKIGMMFLRTHDNF